MCESGYDVYYVCYDVCELCVMMCEDGMMVFELARWRAARVEAAADVDAATRRGNA